MEEGEDLGIWPITLSSLQSHISEDLKTEPLIDIVSLNNDREESHTKTSLSVPEKIQRHRWKRPAGWKAPDHLLPSRKMKHHKVIGGKSSEEKEEKESALRDSDNVQYKLSSAEMQSSISTFLRLHKNDVDHCNRYEFFENDKNKQANNNDSEVCARTRTTRIMRIPVVVVDNSDHVLPNYESGYRDITDISTKNGMLERLDMLEKYVGLSGKTVQFSAAKRIQNLENRLLELESLCGGSLGPLLARIEASENELRSLMFGERGTGVKTVVGAVREPALPIDGSAKTNALPQTTTTTTTPLITEPKDTVNTQVESEQHSVQHEDIKTIDPIDEKHIIDDRIMELQSKLLKKYGRARSNEYKRHR